MNAQVDVSGKVDISDQLIQLASQVIDLWLLLAIVITLMAVQMFKAVLKHYTTKYFPNFDRFTRKVIIFVFAYLFGYYITLEFVTLPDVEKWAIAIGVLNPAIYVLILISAQKKKWVRLEGALKMRKVVENDEGELSLEETSIFHIDDIKK